MIQNKFISAAIAIFLMTGPVFADAGKFYIGGRASYSLISFSQDFSVNADYIDNEREWTSSVPEFGYDVIAGYQFAPKWRAELNFGYAGRHIIKYEDSVNFWSLRTEYITANVLRTMWVQDSFSVYAGIGAGVVMLKASFDDLKQKDRAMKMAGRLLFGTEYDITETFALNAQFTVMYNGNMDEREHFSDDTYINIKTSNILTNSFMFGARVKF